MTRWAAVALACWAILAALGWVLHSLVLAALAPIALLAVPAGLVAARERRFDPLEPIWALTVLFAFTYLLVPGLSTLRPEVFTSLSGYFDQPPAQWQAATVLSGLAFLALLAGYFGPAGPALARRLPRRTGETPQQLILATAAAMFAAGVASVVAAVWLADGFSEPLSDLFTGHIRNEAIATFKGNGYLSVGHGLLALSVPVAAVWVAGEPTRYRLLGLAAATVVAEVLLALVLGSRVLALSVPIGLITVYHYRVARFGFATIAAGGAVLAVVSITMLALRSTRSVTDPLDALGALSLTFDGHNFFVNALARVRDFAWGETVLEDLTITLFPRALWSGKPEVYGIVAAQDAIVPGLFTDIGGNRATFPPGILAEGYLNFGVAGVLAFPFVAALGIRAIYERACQSLGAFEVVVLGYVLANLPGLLRGLGGVLPGTILTLLLVSPLLWTPRASTR